MKKWKRDIFTVIEVVSNWFEAGEGSTKISEKSEEDTTWAQGREGPTRSVTGESLNEGVNWTSGCEGPTRSVMGDTITEGADWAPDREGTTEYWAGEEALHAAHVVQGGGLVQSNDTETTSRSEVQPQSTSTAEVNDWLTATRPPGDRVLTEPKPVTAGSSEDTRSRALNAFWSLLRTAGYEEW